MWQKIRASLKQNWELKDFSWTFLFPSGTLFFFSVHFQYLLPLFSVRSPQHNAEGFPFTYLLSQPEYTCSILSGYELLLSSVKASESDKFICVILLMEKADSRSSFISYVIYTIHSLLCQTVSPVFIILGWYLTIHVLCITSRGDSWDGQGSWEVLFKK